MDFFGGIDIGGTGIKYGVVDAQGATLWEGNTPTLAQEGLAAVLGRIKHVTQEIVRRNPEAKSIGVGVPGVVDPITKRVQAPPNLPGWDSVDLLQELRSVCPLPIDVENDANAAALAEALMGAGVNEPNFLYATLGTGIGGGVILNGRLYRGPHGDAGEIGHIIMDAWAREGARDTRLYRTGVLEDYVGNQGILKMAREQGEEVRSVRDISNDYVLREAGRIIGLGMCSALAVLGLRVLIVGGGISQAPFILDTIRSTMALRAIPTIAQNLRVLPARFGSHAGLIGAAAVGRALVVS